MKPSELRAHLRAALTECKQAQPAMVTHWDACLAGVMREPEDDLLFFVKYFRHVARQLNGLSKIYDPSRPSAKSGESAATYSASTTGINIASDAGSREGI